MSNKSEQSEGSANIQEQIPYQLNESGLDTHHSEDSEFQEMANRKIEELEKKIQQQAKMIEEQAKRIEALERKNEELTKETQEYEKRIEALEKKNEEQAKEAQQKNGKYEELIEALEKKNEEQKAEIQLHLELESRNNRIHLPMSEIIEQSDQSSSNLGKIWLKITLISASLKDRNPINAQQALVHKFRGQNRRNKYATQLVLMRDGRYFSYSKVIYMLASIHEIEIEMIDRNQCIKEVIGSCWMKGNEILQMAKKYPNNDKQVMRNGQEIGTLTFTAEVLRQR